jgi:hypothetical protein
MSNETDARNQGNNVIQFTPDLRFTKSDKNYMEAVRKAFEDAGLPHILCFGETDEGQEWCVVSKILNIVEDVMRPVADITKIPTGYRHVGGWGVFEAKTLREVFDRMPPAYENIKQNIQEK